VLIVFGFIPGKIFNEDEICPAKANPGIFALTDKGGSGKPFSSVLKSIISFLIRKTPRTFMQKSGHHAARFLKIFYSGNRVECPVCGSRFRKFFPYGRNPARDNALCLNCLALERHRLLWLYLKEKTGLFHMPMKVLHIAPESCFIDRLSSFRNLEYITADLESPLAKIRMDIHNIPFPDSHFDAVICNHVMEHVRDDFRAMREILRVLKPAGWAIIQSPIMGGNLDVTFEDPAITDPAAREIAYGQSDHLRLYGRDYPDRLRRAGFKVLEDNFVKTLDPVSVERYALPAEEVIFFNTKE
jgi:SAM-dependent methyltransferase